MAEPGMRSEREASRGAWIPLLACLLLGAGGFLACSALVGLLGPVLGGSHAAQGATLAAILASFWVGSRIRGREGRAAILLMLAAAFLLCAPVVLPLLAAPAGRLWSAAGGGPLFLYVRRFSLALLGVAFPCVCLGSALGQFPVPVGAPLVGRRSAGLPLAVVAAGGAFGLLNGVLRLFPLGGETSLALAAAALLFSSAVLAGVSRRRGTLDRPPAGDPVGADSPIAAPGLPFVWGLTAVSAVLCWERILSLVTGPTVETSALVLGIFLAGVALGALVVAIVAPRAASRVPWVPLGLAGAGIAAAALLYPIDRLPILYLTLAPFAVAEPFRFAAGSWWIAARLILLPAMLCGAVLALSLPSEAIGGGTGTAAPRRSSPLGGVLFGGFVAAWLVPLLSMPETGFRRTLMTAAALLLLASAVGFFRAPGWRALLRWPASIAAVGLAAGLFVLPAPGDLRLLSAGVYRHPTDILGRFKDAPAYREERVKVPISFYREGGEATVAVERIEAQGGPVLALTQDGALVASSNVDLIPQILFAEIPLVMRPKAREVLLIGYGSGIAAGSALLHPLASLEAVEPEREVLEASREFEPANRSPRKDARLKIRNDDPRQILQARAAAAYDVILARPALPDSAAARWQTTRQFYRLAASRLRRGGLFAQSIPLRGVDAAGLSTLLRTMRSAFADVVLLQTYYQEALVLASPDRILFDREAMQKAMTEPKILSDLGRIGIAEPEGILVRYRLSGAGLESFVRRGRVLTDAGRPLLWAGYAPGAPPPAERVMMAVDRHSRGLASCLAPLAEGEAGNRLLLRIARAAIAMKDPVRARDLADTLLVRGALADGHQILGDAHHLRQEQIAAVEEWHRALEADPKHVNALVSLADYQFVRQNHAAAEEYLRQAIEADPADPVLRYYHGRALFFLKRYAESEKDLAKALGAKGERGAPLALYYLGLIQKEKKNYVGAAEFLRRYLVWAYRQERLTAIEADAHLALAEIYEALHLPDLAAQQKKAGEDLKERVRAAGLAKRKAVLEMLGGEAEE